MNRRLFLMGVMGAAVGCTSGRSRRLNVYNWENYVASATLPTFEREFNCRVRYATYGSAEEMLAKVMSGNSGWDVVFPSNSFVQPMRDLTLLEHLDHKRLGNLSNLEQRFRSPEWDPHLDYCVPYMHSATGVAYSKQFPARPSLGPTCGPIPIRGALRCWTIPPQVFGACLKVLHQSINSTDPQQLRAARDLAIRQKPLLRAYISEEVRDQLITGDVLVAQMWAQVAQVAMDNSTKLAFSFPAEGFALYADNAAILRESKHKELAYDFLNYLLEPKVAANIAMEMRTATANAAARALLPVTQRENTVLYPTREILARGEWFKALPGPAQRLRDRYWTEIKSA